MEIISKRINGQYIDTADGLRWEGSFQQNSEEILKQFSAIVSKLPVDEGGDPEQLGEVYSYLKDDKIALTYNGFPANIIGTVAEHAEALVAQLGGEVALPIEA